MMMTYDDFKKEILNMTGVNLDYYKEKQMKRRIDSLIRKNKFEGYFDYLANLRDNVKLFNEFINYLTINVSEFYRNPEQWDVFKNDILPRLFNKNTNLKIWSTACATGEEPYTTAMIIKSAFNDNRHNVNIIGTDLDDDAIEKAKQGIYTFKSVEKLPKEYLENYFIKIGEYYKIKDDIKRCVRFGHLDLLRDPYPENCDIIICRNVIIYFTEEAKKYVYAKLSEALCPNGVLFVGSTEQIIMPWNYNFAPIRTFFYEKI